MAFDLTLGGITVRTRVTRRLITFVAIMAIFSQVGGCASQPAAEKSTAPKPQVMHVPDPAKAATPGPITLDQTIKKDLFNINLSPGGIKVNGVDVASVKALDKLLSKYSAPIITIATHRCYSNAGAAKIISLAQSHTVTPIAIGSFGDLSDPECQ